MKNVRIGLGRGLGCGYKNIAPMDSHIHSLSAKGVRTYTFSSPVRKQTAYDIVQADYGIQKQKMQLIPIKSNEKGTKRFVIEWEVGDGLDFAEIGIWVKGKKVTEFDGVFELPDQAITLLKKNGYDTSEVDMSDYKPNLNAKGEKPICTCEDYPCCGHSAEMRRMTHKEWDDMIKAKVRRSMKEDNPEYGSGDEEDLYAKGKGITYFELQKFMDGVEKEGLIVDRNITGQAISKKFGLTEWEGRQSVDLWNNRKKRGDWHKFDAKGKSVWDKLKAQSNTDMWGNKTKGGMVFVSKLQYPEGLNKWRFGGTNARGYIKETYTKTKADADKLAKEYMEMH